MIIGDDWRVFVHFSKRHLVLPISLHDCMGARRSCRHSRTLFRSFSLLLGGEKVDWVNFFGPASTFSLVR